MCIRETEFVANCCDRRIRILLVHQAILREMVKMGK